ncbi:D-isomer specific 2-hydroxyacid dehydrogenase family protein [Aspergillus ibericus CBS 121593]|uniref:Glycerate dehydrogenase n=1 Tax=Aspergillus ibericus CBS 121593 TaxID=1448316 RepID=A0A395GPN8_9EURO|nr:glycerate dehydrogenase [Aspergillus ibericus CBS 121593]RAK97455.1 glycerate dehydrogenase [Aspergillus ibericus CBS 121593]
MAPPSSPTDHHIVALQADFIKIPEFQLPAPYTCTTTLYGQTSLSELHERIHDASILVLSALRVDAEALSPEVTPYLKLIVIVAAGTDCVDLEACRTRDILVSNCPAANTEAVSEHAIGLYFSTRRRVLRAHTLTRAGEWPRKKTLVFDCLNHDGTHPLTCQEEVAGIIGNGAVGKRIAQLARGLGMKVIIAERKQRGDASAPIRSDNEQGRVAFDAVIKQSTVLFIAVPLAPSTRNLLSTAEFEAMSPHAVLVNVSRGGVVDEEALVRALQRNQITGAATDVFAKEPAGPENSPLLAEGTEDLNLVLTPHLAWATQQTLVNYERLLKETVEKWLVGEFMNVVT